MKETQAMNSKPEIGTIVTFNSSFGSETGKVVGYATLDPDTLQIESNGDIFAKHYSDVTVVVETPTAEVVAQASTPEVTLTSRRTVILRQIRDYGKWRFYNAQLRNAIWLVENGYCERDYKNNTVSLTEKGREYLAAAETRTQAWLDNMDKVLATEPQAAVAVETPAAPDSDYQPMVGDDVSIKYTTDNYHGIVRDVTSDSISIVRYNQTILSFLLSDVIVTLVSRPTSATVAINDDSAVDNTPSEQQSNDGQPETLQYLTVNQAGEPVWKSVDDLPAGYEWKQAHFGLALVNTGIIEGTVKSGWVADALATVNVTSEAAAYDDFLPPTVDEDNDDLPFSDNGQDDTPNWTSIDGDIIDSQRERIYELEAQNWQRNETIASLEADLKAYHSLFSELWDTVQLADASEFVDEIEAILKSFERAQIMRKAGK